MHWCCNKIVILFALYSPNPPPRFSEQVWHESYLSHRGSFMNPEHLCASHLWCSPSPLTTFRDSTILECFVWIAQSLGFDCPLEVTDCPGNSKWAEVVSILPPGWRPLIIIVLFKPTILSSALLWLACLKVLLSNRTDLMPFLSLWLPCLSLELHLSLLMMTWVQWLFAVMRN